MNFVTAEGKDFFDEQAVMPLVTIGIPTYNRKESLVRALESALAQDYENIEVIISDNCSTDDTKGVCEQYLKNHPRIKYHKNDVNLGPYENFRKCLEMSNGDFFMWLADDDFVDPNYISECLDLLNHNSDAVVVCGVSKFISGNFVIGEGRRFNILSDSPVSRVLSYFWNVYDNTIFYGLYRKRVTDPNLIINCLAGDWLYLAGIVVNGKFMTSENTHIYRSKGGASTSYRTIIRTQNLHVFNLWFPATMIGLSALNQVFVTNYNYRKISILMRIALAMSIFFMIVLRTGLYGGALRLIYRVLTTVLGMKKYNRLKSQYLSMRKAFINSLGAELAN